MNLPELIVAASVFLGACSGAAQMGAASAGAMTQSRTRTAALEQIEAQFLAAAPVIRAGVGESADCADAAQGMQEALEAGLPPLPQGVQRQVRLTASGMHVHLEFTGSSGLQRTRLLSPVGFGLCGGPAPQEVADATP